MALIPATPAGSWAQSSTNGAWFVNFNGFGSVSSNGTGITLAPLSDFNNTHSALVTTVASYNCTNTPITVEATVVNNAQVNTGTPNPWETAWLLWNYTSNVSFYYFALKTNGWELGKENVSAPGAQIFLDTGPSPATTIGVPYRIKIIQTGNEIKAFINDVLVKTYVDTAGPYLTGKVGLYSEDANVTFSNIAVDNGGPAFTGTVTVNPTSIVDNAVFTYTYNITNTGTSAGTIPVSFNAGSGSTINSYSSSVAGGATVATPTGTGNVSTNVTIPVGGSVSFTIQTRPTSYGPINGTAFIGTTPVAVPAVQSNSTSPIDWNNVPQCGAGSANYQRISGTAAVSAFIGGSSNGSASYQPASLSSSSGTIRVSPSTWNAATIALTTTAPANVSAITIGWYDVSNVLQSSTLSLAGLTGINSGTHQLPNAPAGAVVIVSYTVNVNCNLNPGGSISGTLNMPAGITVAGPNNGVDKSCSSLGVGITSSMASSISSVVKGGAVVWTWTIANSGPGDANGVLVTSPLGGCENTRTWTVGGSGGFSGGVSGNGAINGSVNIPNGGTVTFTGTSTVSTSCSASFNVTGNVSVPNGTSPSAASVTVPIVTSNVGTPTVTQSVDVSETYPGGTVVWTVVLRNNNAFGLSDITVTNPLGANVTNLSWTSSGSGVAFGTSGTGPISLTGSLGAGASHTFVITGTVASSFTSNTKTVNNVFTYTNSAAVAQPSLTSTVDITRTVKLVVTKTASAPDVIGGSNIVWTVKVKNIGTGTVNGVSLADPVPSSIISQAWSVVETGGVTGYTVSGNGSITGTFNMPAGSEVAYSIVALTSAAFAGTVCNQATVTYPNGFVDASGGTSQVVKSYVDVRGAAVDRTVENNTIAYTYENPSSCVDAYVSVSLSQPVKVCLAANNTFIVKKTLTVVIDGQDQTFVADLPQFTATNWSGGSGYICQSGVLSWEQSFIVPAGRVMEVYTGTTLAVPAGVKVDPNNSVTLGKGVLVVSE